jgi:hypothetical protein
MSAFQFSSHPAYPFTLEESLSLGASYQGLSRDVDTILHSVKSLRSYFDHAIKAQKTVRRDIGPAPTPNF